MKLVLNCAKFELNAALGNTKAKVDTNSMELVLNRAKSELNQTIGQAKVKQILKLAI